MKTFLYILLGGFAVTMLGYMGIGGALPMIIVGWLVMSAINKNRKTDGEEAQEDNQINENGTSAEIAEMRSEVTQENDTGDNEKLQD